MRDRILIPLALAMGSSCCGSSAFATLNVYQSDSNGDLGAENPSTAYYAVTPNTTANPFTYFPSGSIPNSFVPLNMSFGNSNTNSNQAIYFSVQSTVATSAPSNGGNYYLLVFVNTTSTGNHDAVPISYYGNGQGGGVNPCSYSNGTYSSAQCAAGNLNWSYAVQYTPGENLVVGIYPADLCFGGVGTGASLDGTVTGFCSSNSPIDPIPSQGATSFTLSFSLAQSTSSPAYVNDVLNYAHGTTPTVLSLVESSSQSVAVYLEDGNSTFSCPSSLDNVYVPGDSQILVNTQEFGITPAGSSYSTGGSLLVMGNFSNTAGSATIALDQGTFDSSNAYATGIDVLALGSTGATATGFIDSTSSTVYSYNVGFLMLDQAGLVVQTNPATPGCTVNNVEVAQIQGFLNKNACFIANAAFGDPEASEVWELRRFRDGVLNQSSAGRALARWYYHWSPAAAAWLNARPALKPAARAMLMPFVAWAWFALQVGPIAALLATALISALMAYLSVTRLKGFRRRRPDA